MVDTFLTNAFLMKVILPFALIFVVIYAILQKSKILGDDKKGFDIIVALVISLITISLAYPSDFMSKIIPFFAISAVVVLVILLLFAFSEGSSPYNLPDGAKITIMIAFGIGLVIAIIWASGAWDLLNKGVFTKEGSSIIANIIFLLVIGAVIAVAAMAGGSSGGKKEKK